jgi:5-methylcytosine-specific restriction protein A
MTNRRRLSRLQRTKIFDDDNGVCCICGFAIQASHGERWIIEHLKPLWLGGADDESNMGPAHYRCAIEKTTSEAPVKAKSDRVRANFLGIRKPKRHRWGYGKDDRLKKKIDGTVVERT